MKIKKLAIQQFRSHSDTTLDNLPRFVVVRGPNHSGKTSLVHALELALAGRAETTDDRGAGASDLIRTGAQDGKAIIKLRLQNDPTVEEFRDVRCSLTAASGRTITIGNPADKDFRGTDFADWLKINRDILSCLINGRHFVSLAPADQKAILAGIVLPEHYDFGAEVLEHIRAAGLKVNVAAKPFDFIASVYKQAFDERRDVNRDIKNHVIPEGDTSLAGDVSALKEEIGTLKAKKHDLNVRLTDVGNARSAHRAKLESLQDQKTRAQAKLSTEQQQVELFKKKVLSKAVLKTHEDLAKKKADAQKLDAEIIKVQTLHDEAKQAYEKVTELGRSPNCPRCRQPLSEEQIGLIAKPLIESRNKLGSQIQTLNDQRKSIGDYEGSEREIRNHEQAKIDFKRSEDRVTEAHGEIAGLTKQIEGIGPEPVASDELNEAYAEATRKLQEAEERLGPVAAANALKDAIADARDRLNKLSNRQGKLQKLVETFGPGEDGLQAKLLGQYVGGFQASMNKVLASWGYQCELSFEPYVFGIRRGDVTLPLHLLSESEKHGFAIAFQVALAIHSGLLFAVVDASEIYDIEGRKLMFSALLNAGLDQVIVLGTDQRTEVPRNQEEHGLAYYMFSAQTINNVVTTSVQRLLPVAEKAA
jgi:hypothetical protein